MWIVGDKKKYDVSERSHKLTQVAISVKISVCPEKNKIFGNKRIMKQKQKCNFLSLYIHISVCVGLTNFLWTMSTRHSHIPPTMSMCLCIPIQSLQHMSIHICIYSSLQFYTQRMERIEKKNKKIIEKTRQKKGERKTGF